MRKPISGTCILVNGGGVIFSATGRLVFALFKRIFQTQSLNVHDEITLDKYHLQLASEKSKCLLINKTDDAVNRIELLLLPPCYFARKGESQLLSFSYPDNNLEAVVLIIGNPASTEKRKKWNLEEPMICGEKRQAVYLSEGVLTISTTTLDGGLVCKDSGIDEKDFSYFATEFGKQK